MRGVGFADLGALKDCAFGAFHCVFLCKYNSRNDKELPTYRVKEVALGFGFDLRP